MSSHNCSRHSSVFSKRRYRRENRAKHIQMEHARELEEKYFDRNQIKLGRGHETDDVIITSSSRREKIAELKQMQEDSTESPPYSWKGHSNTKRDPFHNKRQVLPDARGRAVEFRDRTTLYGKATTSGAAVLRGYTRQFARMVHSHIGIGEDVDELDYDPWSNSPWYVYDQTPDMYDSDDDDGYANNCSIM